MVISTEVENLCLRVCACVCECVCVLALITLYIHAKAHFLQPSHTFKLLFFFPLNGGLNNQTLRTVHLG